MKWTAQKGGDLNMGVGGPGGKEASLFNLSPDAMMKMYEMGKEGYLKRHGK